MTLIHIGKDLLYTTLREYCQQHPRQWVIISDSHVEKLYGETLKSSLAAELISFPAGEQYKTRETKQQLEDSLLEKGYGRDTGFIALGGGVVTDLVGFLASTYCRGVPAIYVPTTFLAMVDASIGGKTGVDTPHGKNLIGSFSLPTAIFMDINTLETLPKREWRNGIVETIKHALITDQSLFDSLKQKDSLLPEEIISKSVVIKQRIVAEDQHDHGIRQWLNFGHTIGHAIESVENYQLAHGEAVAIGLLVEAYLSSLLGYLPISKVDELETLLRFYRLPLKTSAFQQLEQLKQKITLDKKTKNSLPHFVLLDHIGKVHQEGNQYTFSVSPEQLDQALHWAKRFN